MTELRHNSDAAPATVGGYRRINKPLRVKRGKVIRSDQNDPVRKPGDRPEANNCVAEGGTTGSISSSGRSASFSAWYSRFIACPLFNNQTAEIPCLASLLLYTRVQAQHIRRLHGLCAHCCEYSAISSLCLPYAQLQSKPTSL